MCGEEMTTRSRLLALIWIVVAVLLRFYGAPGGDASIVGGLLFLIWTAPFGIIWQVWIYGYALEWLGISSAQLLGDALVIAVGAGFWFWLIPALRRRLRQKPTNSP
jgi:hypothetical protein